MDGYTSCQRLRNAHFSEQERGEPLVVLSSFRATDLLRFMNY